VSTTIIKATCAQCEGDGLTTVWLNDEETGQASCPMCSGTGKMDVSEFDISDMDGKLDDILDKCNDIFEKVNE